MDWFATSSPGGPESSGGRRRPDNAVPAPRRAPGSCPHRAAQRCQRPEKGVSALARPRLHGIGAWRCERTTIREELPVVVEYHHTVAQQTPPLLVVRGDDPGRAVGGGGRGWTRRNM